MRNSDIEILEKVAHALAKYLPDEENELLGEYCKVYSRLKGRNDNEKQKYQDKAEYYRERSKQWKLNNPDKQKQHVKNHLAKKSKSKKEKEIDSDC